MAGGIAEAYVGGGLRAFFGSHPGDAADRRRAVARAFRPLAPAVADALERQNAGYVPSPTRDAHLAALRSGAAAVVTGQQVGLFLGPLYTLYKAASAIRAARALAEETGRPVVPVFWLQTEDHDLPEIASISVPGTQQDALSLSLPASPTERISIAHRALPDAVTSRLDELRDALATLPDPAHLERLARHYRPGRTWGEAFAHVVAELFADEGLVLLDPRDPAFAAVAAPIHRRALTDAEALSRALTRRADEIAGAGFDVAVHVRAGSPLSFFHPDGAAGPRYRLDPVPDGLAEVGGTRTHSRDALLAVLDSEPLRFSTSALLRPIFQDTLLPTAAYVGGPGEIAYFAQVSPLYEAFGLPMPLVVPRARFRVIEPRTRRLLEKRGLSPDDVVRPEAELLAKCGGDSRLPDGAEIEARLRSAFEPAFADVVASMGEFEALLDRSIRRTRGTVERAVSRFAARYERARLHRDQALVDDVRRLRMLLHPGAPQERQYGFAAYACRFGERRFVEAVLTAIEPFDARLKDLEP